MELWTDYIMCDEKNIRVSGLSYKLAFQINDGCFCHLRCSHKLNGLNIYIASYNFNIWKREIFRHL